MLYKKSFRSRRPYGRKPSKKGRKSTRKPRVSRAVKSYVSKAIHSNIENKNICSYAANLPLNYAGTATLPTFLTLTPTLSQGTTVAQRVGNEVTVRKGTIKGYVNLLGYNSLSNPGISPIIVKMWLCRRKQTNVYIYNTPNSGDFNNFFQIGNTSAGFQSTVIDDLLSVNKDYWTVLATRRFELQNNYYAAGFDNKIANPSGSSSKPFIFHFGKHLAKLLYNDASTIPVNKELFLVFQTVTADGSYNATQGPYAECHYVTEWTFEDA